MDLQFPDALADILFGANAARIAIVALGLVAIFFLSRLLRRYISKHVRYNAGRYQARKGVSIFGFLAAIILIVLAFSNELGGFAVAFGVLGAGVAFALQEVIASAAGWAAIIFGVYYRVGDRIQLGGIRGDVIDISLLRTTLMEMGDWVHGDQYNGRIVRVANSFVFKEPVFNYSSDFPFLWDEIVLPIKYGSDYHLARKIIEDVAEETVGQYAIEAHEAWEPLTRKFHVEPASVHATISMTADQNWISFTLRYVTDYRRRRSTKDRLFTRILEEIGKHSKEVGIAANTLDIENLAPIDVRLTRSNTDRIESER